MSERAFKGVWIPAEVWLSDELTIYEKAVFAEIDSLDGENHCWASNEYLAEFCKMSVPTISRAISKLIQLGYIEKLSFDGRQRVLAVNKNISQIRETYLTDKSEISPSENLLLIENKKENNIKSTGAGALAKHPRNFTKETLRDDLESGKDIDEQKKEKKKTSEYDKCLVEIDNRYEDPDVYMSLVNHLEWSYNSKDPKRIKTAKIYSKRLDELDKLTGDKVKIVQQSIDKQWHCFYELQTSNNRRGGETLKNDIVTTNVEEAQRLWDEAIKSGKGEYC